MTSLGRVKASPNFLQSVPISDGRASFLATKCPRDEKTDDQADNCTNQSDLNYKSDQFQGNKRKCRYDQRDNDFQRSHFVFSGATD